MSCLNNMAFPHPQPCEDHARKEDVAGGRSVAGKLFKRAVNVAQYRNAKQDMNPAENRTLSGTRHGRLREPVSYRTSDPLGSIVGFGGVATGKNYVGAAVSEERGAEFPDWNRSMRLGQASQLQREYGFRGAVCPRVGL